MADRIDLADTEKLGTASLNSVATKRDNVMNSKRADWPMNNVAFSVLERSKLTVTFHDPGETGRVEKWKQLILFSNATKSYSRPASFLFLSTH